jgi:hypothetical protein
MSKVNLTAINEALYDVMLRLKEGNDPESDPKDGISIERAKAITDVAQVIVNSAKVQCDFLKSVMKETTVNIDTEKKLFLGSS